MTPKRGQPPKPPEKSRTETVYARYTPEEKALLEEAHRLSGAKKTLARWVVAASLDEAKRIVEKAKK